MPCHRPAASKSREQRCALLPTADIGAPQERLSSCRAADNCDCRSAQDLEDGRSGNQGNLAVVCPRLPEACTGGTASTYNPN